MSRSQVGSLNIRGVRCDQIECCFVAVNDFDFEVDLTSVSIGTGFS